MKKLFLVALLYTALHGGDIVDMAIYNTTKEFISIVQYNDRKMSTEKIIPLLHDNILDKSEQALNERVYNISCDLIAPPRIENVQELKNLTSTSVNNNGREYQVFLRTKDGRVVSISLYYQNGKAKISSFAGMK